MKIYLLGRHVFQLKFCLHTKHFIYNYFKYKNKNEIIIIEN